MSESKTKAERDELLDKATDLMRRLSVNGYWSNEFFFSSLAKTLDRINPEWRTKHREEAPPPPPADTDNVRR